MAPLIPIAILLVRLLSGGVDSGAASGVPHFARTGKSMLWWALAMTWGGYVTYTFFPSVDNIKALLALTLSLRDLRDVAISLLITGAGAAGLFFAWPILHALTRYGRPKLVYYLAYVLLIFPIRGDTRSGACLLASLALARRGNVTKEELDWLQERLAKETRALGTFAAASAMCQALHARLARDAGRRAEAENLSQCARTLFGTIIYLSDRGAPRCVRKVAWEYLALDDARHGQWGSLELTPEKDLTPLSRALRGWAREWLMDKPRETATTRARRRLANPVLDSLFVRPTEVIPPRSAQTGWMRARRSYLALVRGEPIGPRATMSMLVTFDILTHPESPDTVLSEAIRAKEDAVSSLHDAIAEALTEALVRAGAPLFAMKMFGPISARVYQHLETALFEEMDRALATLEARLGHRESAFSDWLGVAYVRSVYRRVEQSLGPEAAAQIWPRFAYSYCKLGVELSETYPRMRPLAHAVFKVLSLEAGRFDDVENVTQQAHNMSVTAGVD